jgi:hypothetical protein
VTGRKIQPKPHQNETISNASDALSEVIRFKSDRKKQLAERDDDKTLPGDERPNRITSATSLTVMAEGSGGGKG